MVSGRLHRQSPHRIGPDHGLPDRESFQESADQSGGKPVAGPNGIHHFTDLKAGNRPFFRCRFVIGSLFPQLDDNKLYSFSK